MSRIATPLSALAVLGAAAALAACGSSSDDNASGGSASANGGGTRNADFQKYQQCLKDNGVTLPDRGPDGAGGPGAGAPPAGGMPGGGAPAGVDQEQFQKAQQACAKLRPQGAGRGNGQRPQMDVKAFTPYLTCLKGEGLDVDVADGFDALRDLKQADAKVQAAFKACQAKLPQRPSGGASSAAPAPTA